MVIQEKAAKFNINHQSMPRSPGCHVSELIRDTGLLLGLFKDADSEELDWSMRRYHGWKGHKIPTVFTRVAAGLAWEEWLTKQLPHVSFHLGELLEDGIYLTPDGVEWAAHSRLIVHEYKFTWKSSNREIEHEWCWWAQVKAYCHAIGAKEAYLHVYWVNGDYRGSGPQYRVYHATFTDQELRATWNQLQGIKRRKELGAGA